MKHLLFLTLLFPLQAFTQVKYLDVGDPAPYKGYLFTPESAEKATRSDKLVELYKKDSEYYEQRLNNYRTENENLNKRLSEKNNTFLGNLGYFILGAGVTTLITFGVARSVR